MEGVMMKNQDRYAVAVRKPDHQIDVKVENYKSTIKSEKIRHLPIVRGVVNFVESLVLGMSTLMYLRLHCFLHCRIFCQAFFIK